MNEDIEYFVRLEKERQLSEKERLQSLFENYVVMEESRNDPIESRTSLQQNPFSLYDEISGEASPHFLEDENAEKTNKTDAKNAFNKIDKEMRNVRNAEPVRTNKNKQDHMEQWVSDTFYSYFPSFSNLEKQKNDLIKNRQLDYQNYLKKKESEEKKLEIFDRVNINRPSLKNKDNANLQVIVNNPPMNGNNDDYGEQKTYRKMSAKQQYLRDLKHTELASIVNTNAVQERNKLIVENEAQRKLEYQKDLVRQIEEKRKQIENLKKKEKHDEEMLTRKLEEQLKTMQLEEQIEKDNLKIEMTRLVNEKNNVLRLQLLSKLENDHKLYNPHKNVRATQSENGKDDINGKNKVYKYFSNSARHDNSRLRSKDFFDPYDTDWSEALIKVPSRNSHQNHIEMISAENLLKLQQNEMTVNPSNAYVCQECKNEFFNYCCCQTVPKNICSDCIRNCCINCSKPLYKQTSHHRRQKQLKNVRKSFQILDSPAEEFVSELTSDQVVSQRLVDKQKSSRNERENVIISPETKIIGPNLDDSQKSMDELRQQTNQRLSKYAENYGDLKVRNDRLKTQATQTSFENTEKKQTNIPSLPEIGAKEEVTSEFWKEIERIPAEFTPRQEMPAMKKATNTLQVLTHIGAFKKQLQLDHLELDDAHSEEKIFDFRYKNRESILS